MVTVEANPTNLLIFQMVKMTNWKLFFHTRVPTVRLKTWSLGA